MARSWAQLLGEEGARPDTEEGGGGMFARLRDSLGRSRRALTEQIGVGTFDAGDDASWERLEEALIAADVGVPATAELVQRLERRGDAGIGLTEGLQEEIARMLGEPAQLNVQQRPSVILVVGVNGTGKTTTIGKLASKLSEHGPRCSSRPPTRSAPPPRSSSRSGPSAPGPTSSARSGAASRRPSPSTRSTPRRPAGATSWWWTPRDGCTPRRT